MLVPHRKSKDRTIKCIRLVEPDSQLPEGSIVVGAQDVDEDEKDAVFGTPGTAYTLTCDVINPGNQMVILTSNLTSPFTSKCPICLKKPDRPDSLYR